jgi:hypothetical protein
VIGWSDPLDYFKISSNSVDFNSRIHQSLSRDFHFLKLRFTFDNNNLMHLNFLINVRPWLFCSFLTKIEHDTKMLYHLSKRFSVRLSRESPF